ncbi:MAG: DUF6491 family protein [Gammaproteobacteria bacterium]|nr:DUF6491 family protein [Gammaproteobacteria bacterium]
MKTNRRSGMVLFAWFVLGAGAAGAAEPAATDKVSKAERLEAILNETLPESEYRDTTRCLPTSHYRKIEILSDRYLIFRGRGERVWINRLRNRCHGLRKNQILVFKRFGMNLCGTDQVTGRDRGFGIGGSATCMLGEFEEINERRADALKEAFRQARRS